jgi:hypothetical protein
MAEREKMGTLVELVYPSTLDWQRVWVSKQAKNSKTIAY